MNRLLSIVFFAGAVAAAMLLSSCGSSREAETDTRFVWPPPPDTARIRYVRTLRGEEDFSGGLGNVVSALAGATSKISLSRPFDVCVAGEDRIYVTDVSNGVFMFDTKEGKVEVLGEKTSIDLKNPRGIAYGHGKVFVTLASTGQVAVLDPEGRLLRLIGRPGEFLNAVDIVCDTSRSRILILDNKLHRFYAYTEEGDSLFTAGRRGEGDGEFNYPQSLAVDAAGSIYVVDAMNFRVEIFDSAGTYVRQFGQQGDAFGMFNRPKGIALDRDGNIFVLDALHQNFQIFNQAGELLLFVGKYSRGNDGFENPVSIAISRGGMVYVTDQLNSRVQVFKLLY